MEFDFKKDYLSDKAMVKLSMGHEAFGTWLEQEGQNKKWVVWNLVRTRRAEQKVG